MKRISVVSSNIASVGFDEGHLVLEVEFKDGGLYQYANVPSREHANLMSASSTGGYFAANIRDKYRTTKL